jgi:Ca2+-binding EF-hand superfamily protein
MLTLLILYARGSLEERLGLIFQLFCYENQTHMQQDEFNFMLDKLSTSVSSVLSLRKTHLLEIAKTAEQKMTPQHDKISQDDFVHVMMTTMKQFSSRLNDLRSRIDVFEIKIQNERLP